MRDVVGFPDRLIHEVGNLLGDVALPIQRFLDGFLSRLEVAARRRNRRDLDLAPGIDQEAHEAHGVGALFLGLTVEVRRQFRQAFAREVGRDGHVLQRGAELVADLLVQRGVHRFTDDHRVLLQGAARRSLASQPSERCG